jgi:hypothetical protein
MRKRYFLTVLPVIGASVAVRQAGPSFRYAFAFLHRAGTRPTVVLTLEQVEELRRALDEIAPQSEERLRLMA